MHFCPQCATPVVAHAKACQNCGTTFRPGGFQPVAERPDLSKPDRAPLELMVRPASWRRRTAALAVDLLLLGGFLWAVAQTLPGGGPPADPMSYFSPQEFRNHFVLVGLAVMLTAASFLMVAWPLVRGTPGQYLLGLELRALSGERPSRRQILARMTGAVVRILILAVPGPIIALLIGWTVAEALHVPFTTTDQLLIDAGVPTVARFALHSLSFIALGAGLWFVVVRPVFQLLERFTEGLTLLDLTTRSTHVRRRDLQED
ncbi:MAG: RDD family protein [Rubrivivax sp.]|jgi:hypothetical protein